MAIVTDTFATVIIHVGGWPFFKISDAFAGEICGCEPSKENIEGLNISLNLKIMKLRASQLLHRTIVIYYCESNMNTYVRSF